MRKGYLILAITLLVLAGALLVVILAPPCLDCFPAKGFTCIVCWGTPQP